MARYLLDTHILEWLFDSSNPHNANCLDNLSRIQEGDEVFVHILSIYELEYSAANASPEDHDLRSRICETTRYIPEQFQIAQLSIAAASLFGHLKAGYRLLTKASASNMKKHGFDIMLASTALELQACIVSMDGIFTALSGLEPRLTVVNWASRRVTDFPDP